MVGWRGVAAWFRNCYPILLVAAPVLVGEQTWNTITGTTSGAALQKGAVLALIVVAGFILGWQAPPLSIAVLAGVFAVALVAAVIQIVLGQQLPTLEQAGRGFLGLVVFWPLFLLRLRRIPLRDILIVIALLPTGAILIGAVLQLAGVGSILFFEYTGVVRLKAALPPAYLASFGMFAVLAACWLWLRLGTWWPVLLAALNIVVVLLTGTRGPLLVALALTLATFFFGRPHGTGVPGKVKLAAAGGVAVLVAFAAPALIARSVTQGQQQGALSGRGAAWAYFFDYFTERPVFGWGPGASAAASAVSDSAMIRSAFIAPHNTYLQFLVDTGLFGLVGLLACLAWLITSIYRRSAPAERLLLVVLVGALAFYAFFDNLLTSPHPAFMFVLTLATFAACSESDRRGDSLRPPSPVARHRAAID